MAVDGKVVYKVDYDVKDAKKNISDLGTKLTNVGKQAGELGSTMTKNITVPLMAVGGAALAGFTKISTELDNIGKSAAGVNASVEGLQALQFAGRKAGIETDKMTDVLKKVQELTTRNADAFEESGITIRDMNGEMLNSDTIFTNIIESMSDMSAEQRNATLLSLGFTEELIAMNKAMDDTKGFTDNMSTGLENAISDDSIKKFEEFNDQIEDIKLQLIPIGVDIAEQLMPYLEDFADWLGGDGIDKISAFVSELADFVEQNWKLIGVLAIAGPALSTFSNLVGAAMKVNGLIKGIQATTAAGSAAGGTISAWLATGATLFANVAGAGAAAHFIAKGTDDYVDENLGFDQMDQILGDFGAKLVDDSTRRENMAEFADFMKNGPVRAGGGSGGFGGAPTSESSNRYMDTSTKETTTNSSGYNNVNFGGMTINTNKDFSGENAGAISEDIMTEVTNMLEIRGVMK